jgi:hypothetical protein
MHRQFFDDFSGQRSSWNETKDQIAYRIQGVLQNDTLARFFTGAETKIDLFELLNSGAIIVIDTAIDHLGKSHSLFGRFWISLILQAILERGAPGASAHPTFLYVDEAGSYFDSNIEQLLTDVRKFKCGCIFSHQELNQASPALLAALNANTSSKFAVPSAADARAMATEMYTTPEFLLNLPEYDFGAYLRGITPQAIPASIASSIFDIGVDIDYSKRSAAFRAANRQRVSFGPIGHQYPMAAEEGATYQQQTDEKPDREW